MLRFEQHTETKWNVFRDEGKVYIASFWTGKEGGIMGASKLLTANEFRSIADRLDELNGEGKS